MRGDSSVSVISRMRDPHSPISPSVLVVSAYSTLPSSSMLSRLFAFKGVGGVGVGRSGPECRWWRGRRAHPAASRAQVRMEGCGGEWFGVPVPRLFLFVGALHPIRRQCTSSVRVHRHVTGAVPPCLWRLWRLSGLRGSSVLELSSAWVVFCLGLCGASCCGSSEMSHAIPRHVFQTLKSHRWNCNVLGCCTKFGYPNCVRVLVDEAPEASSCVRSSSHDTVHNPRDASNTTPTPQNAKSHLSASA